MSGLSEISSLFAALASNLGAQDPAAGNDVDASITNLTRSLNLSDQPRVRILDAALSLMCVTAPQVCDTVIDFTLKTIVTVLFSSVECKVLWTNKEQVLRVGGLVSKSDCAKIMEGCANILGKLDGHKGDMCYSLLYNVFRVAALAPRIPHAMLSNSDEMKFDDSSTSALANLVLHLPKEFTFKNDEIPLRSLLWHLHPVILKQDISQILREIIKRPFLYLREDFYDRTEWRSIIICLVNSPTMFIETRALLHNWFLMTGLASVMELQTEIVAQVLDIISRPMWWGLSMEVGSKIPFSHAYFPYEHHLLRILTGPISLEYFQQLLHKTSGLIVGDHLYSSSRKTATTINIVDHKSMWAMVMNFPGWFFFACIMLFSNNGPADNFYSRSVPVSVNPCVIHDQEVTHTALAAKFIAWILNPMSDSNQHLAFDYLVEVSDLWALRYSSPHKCNELTRACKETGRPKLNNYGINSQELDSWTVAMWLKEFKDLHIKHFGTKADFSASNTKGFSMHQNPFLRRIPLGILLLCPNSLSGAACSLILHYAATGIIPEFTGFQNSQQSWKRWKCDLHGDPQTCTERCTKAEAVAGCRAVFDITDIAESRCDSLSKTEEGGLNLVGQVKLKACDYLLKCIKRLLQIKMDGDGLQMQRDLLTRVLRWRCQGRDIFQNNKDLDCVCDALNALTASCSTQI